MQVANNAYREGWERIFNRKSQRALVVEFECSLCHKKHPITDSFEWGLPKVPKTLVSSNGTEGFFLRCLNSCQNKEKCFCDKEATHEYTYSNHIAMEDKNGKRPTSLLCQNHSVMFARFAGSIRSLNTASSEAIAKETQL
jgi:hypothetical protein